MKSTCILLAAATLFGSGSLSARAELVNAIMAIVHDAVITYEEVRSLNERTEGLLVSQYRNQPTQLEKKIAEMRTENLDTLMDRQLILHEFQSAGYSIPEKVIDDLVDETIKTDFGDRATMTKTLQERGLTFEKFRQQLRERFIVQQLRLKNVSSEIIISPHKVELYYAAHREEFKVEDEVKLRMIVLNKSSDPNALQAKTAAEEILGKLKEGVPFAELAGMYSQGSQRNQGGSWGWTERSVLRKELAEVAFTLKPGEHSGVIETPDACYIMLVEDARTSHYKPLSEVRLQIEKNLTQDERNRVEKLWLDRLRKKTFVRRNF
jgi:peptidyl-prolyl cis-trans isomerase SurA